MIRLAEAAKRPRSIPTWFYVALISSAWFWFWRSNVWSGGDSEQWEREIGQGLWLRKRQLLSFACMQLSFRAGYLLFGWTAHVAINFVSCLAGALTMAMVWQFFDGCRFRKWQFLLIASAGFSALFCGHIETYPQAIAALTFHLLALRRVVQGRWMLWTLPATFALAMLFHLAVLYAAPVALLALGWECWLRKPSLPRWLAVLAALSLAPAILAMLTVYDVGRGEFVGPHFILPLPELLARPWAVFTNHLLPIKAQMAWWNGGVVCVIVWLVCWRVLKRRRHDREAVWLIGYFLCFVGFVLVWRPDMLLNDWDLFSFPWPVACLLVAREVPRIPLRGWIFGIILGFNVMLFVTRPMVFAEVNRRGYGTIYLQHSAPNPGMALIDQRQFAYTSNAYLLVGPHMLQVYHPPYIMSSSIVNVKKGGQYYYLWDGRRLVLTRMEEP